MNCLFYMERVCHRTRHPVRYSIDTRLACHCCRARRQQFVHQCGRRLHGPPRPQGHVTPGANESRLARESSFTLGSHGRPTRRPPMVRVKGAEESASSPSTVVRSANRTQCHQGLSVKGPRRCLYFPISQAVARQYKAGVYG